MIKLSIASYSFHRLLKAGKQDIYQYITDCKTLGATQLDPWNGHLDPLVQKDNLLRAQKDTSITSLSEEEKKYLSSVRLAAEKERLPFGCLAVDGAHIYDNTLDVMQLNRAIAYRWLEAAEILGAEQVRIDAGGPETLTDPILATVTQGYQDLLQRAKTKKLEILIENHWGVSRSPDNVVKILNSNPGLGLLFDTNNWTPGEQEKGWQMCAKYARSVHIKTFSFDEQGYDPSVNLPLAIRLLVEAGYQGTWGVESVPRDGDEYSAVEKTFALIKKVLKEMDQ
jgi:sugar phosphate isomerase/epimerase